MVEEWPRAIKEDEATVATSLYTPIKNMTRLPLRLCLPAELFANLQNFPIVAYQHQIFWELDFGSLSPEMAYFMILTPHNQLVDILDQLIV